MLLEEERNLLVDYGKKLVTENLTKGTGGNLSIYNREKELMAISPSGLDYFKTEAKDIVIMDLSGNIIEGKRPSSEYNMHLIFYKNREDISAIVHTHSTFASVLATNRIGLPSSSYLIAVAGKDIRCASYASFGSEELAVNAFKAMEDRRAVLLANHGLLAGGENLSNAFNIAVQIEHCAEVYYRAKSIGEPVLLSDEEMEKMLERFKTYGRI